MSQTEKKWSDFEERPSKVFGYEVPVFTPSIFREFRGEIFTTFHSEEHPVMKHIHYDKSEISIHKKIAWITHSFLIKTKLGYCRKSNIFHSINEMSLDITPKIKLVK